MKEFIKQKVAHNEKKCSITIFSYDVNWSLVFKIQCILLMTFVLYKK